MNQYMRKQIVSIIIALLCFTTTLSAAPVISLLTCGPTDKYVFYLYGHTALRVQDNGEDWVYNYGYFSLQQKNFIINFMIGKPMYSVGVVPFQDFLMEYHAEGRSVTEQVLNLTPSEAQAMYDKLRWNALPENRDYQYNFYFDNCATRPRDFIWQFSGGLTCAVDPTTMPTFREALRHMSNTAQWYTMGADLCLGWKSDEKMTIEDAAFLPELLEQEMDLSKRKDNGEAIVLSKVTHLPQTKIVGEHSSPIRWPFWTPVLVAILYALLYYFAQSRGKESPLKLLQTTIYTLLGIGGVALYFLAFSSHPHTFPNANMLLMHPLHFMLAGWIWRKNKVGKPLFWLYFVNFVAVVCYLGMGYKQVLPEGMAIWGLLMLVDFFLGTRRNWLLSRTDATATK